MATYDAGIVTAYGAAVRGGYTGTYEQFCTQQANYAASAAAVEQAKEDVQELVDSIPADYSQMSADVTQLKEDLGDINDLETTDKSNIIAAINEAAHSGGSGLTDTQKELIIMILRNAMYTSDQSGNINDLEDAFANTVISISATLDLRGNTIYSDDTLDTLRQYLVVRATYDDGSTQTVTGYALSGTLTVGTSTIQVIYRDATASVNVPVSQAIVRYTVTNNLTGVTNSNTDASITEGNTYTGILTAETTGYIPTNVSVTVGGVNVTSTAYNPSTRTITIENVSGNIVITAVADEDTTLPVYTLATPMTESGVIDYVLFDQDRDWTIVWTVSTPANSGIVHFENLASDRTHPFEAYTGYVSGTGWIRIWDTAGQTLNSAWLDGTVAGEQKIVITHDVGGDTKGYWKQTNMKSGRESYGQGSKTLTVGSSTARSDTGITVTITDNAVLEDFKIYKRILTNEEISDYVGWTVNE